MPNKDGTGPNGQGPRTGRWEWNCDSKEKVKANTDFGKKNGKWTRQWRWQVNSLKK